MAGTQKRPAADLALSDIAFKQVSNGGQVRECYAHKAVLNADSCYFLKAFTGDFREASATTMEVHDDDPDHFEFLLRHMYTLNYDKDTITKLPAGDPTKRVLIPIGIYAAADKYDAPYYLRTYRQIY